MPCPECGAKRGHLLGCSRSEPAFLAVGVPRPAPTTPPDDEPRERLRLWAFPVAYLLAWGLVSTGPGAFIGRTCFGMWLHELGHALAAWLCGQWALPLPWFTATFGPSLLVSALDFGLAAALLAAGAKRRSSGLIGAGAALGGLALGCHLLRPSSQEVLFNVAGEAGAMLLGTLLSTAFLLAPGVKALQGGLRWGWLTIGAISWADAAHLWVLARRDPANLPLGLENGTESDATKLIEHGHWAEDALVSRFLGIAAVALGLAGLAWALALWRAQEGRRGAA